MAWLTLRNFPGTTLSAVMDEVEAGSHRATAIVAASFVDDHLTRLLQWRLVQDEPLQEKMFAPSAAIGDFSTKINLGYLIGFYTKAAWQELDTIRRIRNGFAHELHINSFNIQSIKDRCANLVLWERLKMKIRKSADFDNSKKLIILIGESVDNGEQEMPLVDLINAADPAQPYQRYVAACRFFIAAFSVLIHEEHSRATPMI